MLLLLHYAGQNIALFSGGLFAGAAIYVSLTECPPRTALSQRELILLAHAIGSRTNALLLGLAMVTAGTALAAAVTGGGILWLSGGLLHLAVVAFMLTDVRKITRMLETLHPEDDEDLGEKLMQRRTAQVAILAMGGLAAQYLFIVA
jgi:hypothetical protein